jgi:adenylate cyclase
MNAPPKVHPVTAHSDGDVVHWLINDTRDERFIDNIFAELCVRLRRAGIPVKRASLHVLIYSAMAWSPDHVGGRDARGRDCEI